MPVKPWLRSRIEPFADRVGLDSDGIVAKRAGISPGAVTNWRRRRHIPAAPPDPDRRHEYSARAKQRWAARGERPRPQRARSHGHRGSSWIRPAKRWAIYARDEGCVWCGQLGAFDSLDHLWPSRQPRDNAADALVTACASCNKGRKQLSIGTWLKLLRTRGVDVRTVILRLKRRHQPLDAAAGRELRAAVEQACTRLPLLEPGSVDAATGGVIVVDEAGVIW